jgi:hypothetical protein
MAAPKGKKSEPDAASVRISKRAQCISARPQQHHGDDHRRRGNAISWASSGGMGFREQEVHPFAAQTAAETAAKAAMGSTD